MTDLTKAKEALAALPWPVIATDGDRLTVEAPRSSAADISRALAERQVYLYELRPRETSLEEIFLQLTREEQGETEDVGPATTATASEEAADA